MKKCLRSDSWRWNHFLKQFSSSNFFHFPSTKDRNDYMFDSKGRNKSFCRRYFTVLFDFPFTPSHTCSTLPGFDILLWNFLLSPSASFTPRQTTTPEVQSNAIIYESSEKSKENGSIDLNSNVLICRLFIRFITLRKSYFNISPILILKVLFKFVVARAALDWVLTRWKCWGCKKKIEGKGKKMLKSAEMKFS